MSVTEVFTVKDAFNEINRLRAENELLRQQNERLKKALAEERLKRNR